MKSHRVHPKFRVMICPLDWGLGHATRCVPIVNEFLRQGCEVFLGCTGGQQAFFSQEFPDLEQIPCPPYQIMYPEQGFMMPFWLLHQIPRLKRLVAAEQLWTESICKSYQIDLVVSDNRFGCYSRKHPSIYITHQVRIAFPSPFQSFEPLGEKLHGKIQASFQEVWIPDSSGPDNLGGKLSHCGLIPGKHRFIGSQTRFFPATAEELSRKKDIDILALLSGPEPQRTLLEKQLLPLLVASGRSCMLVQGKPGEAPLPATNNQLRIYSHLPSKDLRQAILSSKLVLCRSGYSTLMDLQALQAKAVLIPTPGQTEQEYLARDLFKRRVCGHISQDRITQVRIDKQATHANGFPPVEPSFSLLQSAITQALSRIQ
jgi:hypothetical protein